MSILAVENLSISLTDGRRLAKIENLNLAQGDCLGLIGGSGVGKTTLVRGLLARALEVSMKGFQIGGHVRWSGSRIGYCSQSEGLVPWVTVGRQLATVVRSSASGHLAQEVLAQLDIEGLSAHFPRELSGGEYQRCQLALAFLACPDLLVLDEPLSAVDIVRRTRIVTFLAKWQRAKGTATILIAHDIDMIAYWASRLAILSGDGSIKLVTLPTARWSEWNEALRSVEFGERRELIWSALGVTESGAASDE